VDAAVGEVADKRMPQGVKVCNAVFVIRRLDPRRLNSSGGISRVAA